MTENILTDYLTRSVNGHALLAPATANQLRVGGISLLVVRPDGHVGLRAERNHLEALAAYHSLLAFGRSSH